LRTAEALREAGHRGRLTIVGAEGHLPYDRPPLSKQILTGRRQAADTVLAVPDGLDADWRLGRPARRLDLAAGVVEVDGGERIGFDMLVIATGSHPRVPAGLAPLGGVHTLRTIDDALAVRAAFERGARPVVIGAGFIGLEVASAARALDLPVTVLELAEVPLERAIGPAMGRHVAAWHRSHGVDLRTGVGVDGLVGDAEGHVRAVTAGGEEVEANVVVVGVGVTPSTAWLEGSGIVVDDGVRTDGRLRARTASGPLDHVVAAGDVARVDGPDGTAPVRSEHWTAATEQAQIAAATLLGGDDAPEHRSVAYFWSDQFDRKIQMLGATRPGDDTAVVDGSLEENRFVVAYGREGRLVAALGFGRPAKVMALNGPIAAGAPFPPAG
jgi:NADPH-dependent 2,4-dienoyl-CoA reductase/sulfur reductase-like enzyme